MDFSFGNISDNEKYEMCKDSIKILKDLVAKHGCKDKENMNAILNSLVSTVFLFIVGSADEKDYESIADAFHKVLKTNLDHKKGE